MLTVSERFRDPRLQQQRQVDGNDLRLGSCCAQGGIDDGG